MGKSLQEKMCEKMCEISAIHIVIHNLMKYRTFKKKILIYLFRSVLVGAPLGNKYRKSEGVVHSCILSSDKCKKETLEGKVYTVYSCF